MAATTTPPRTEESRRAEWLLAAITLASVLPLFAPRHLPFTDLPEHVAVVSALAHWSDPTWRVAEHYVIAFPRTPYVLFHFLAGGLTMVLGDAELVVRLLLALAGIALPLAVRRLLRAMDVDERLALFAPLVFWNRALAIGFLPFVVSVPVLLLGIALAVENGKDPTTKRRVALAVLGFALFYLHVSSFILFATTAVALTIHLRGPRRAWREIPWLVPGALAALGWIALGGIAIHGGRFLEAREVGYENPASTLFSFPLWAHDIWRSHVDEACAIVWWLAIVLLAIVSMRSAAGTARDLVTRLLPLGCVLLVYFLTPHQAGVGVFLNVRLAPLIALAALPVLRPSRGPATNAALAAAAFSALVMSGYSAWKMRVADDAELGRIDEVLARIPRGARVIGLNFDLESAHVQFSPWIYAVSYHRVRNGGVTAYSFAETAHWPVRLVSGGDRPVKREPFWAQKPCVFRNATDGVWFDYVLTRGDLDPFEREPAGPRFHLVDETRGFRLYAKIAGAPPWPEQATPDEGPCSGETAAAR